MRANGPILASTGTAVVLVGNVDTKHDQDLKATALLRWWHAFFAGIDACKPKQAYLAVRDTAHFEYVLQLDQLGEPLPHSAADAAVESMTRFAIDVLKYSSKVGVNVRLGMDIDSCTTGFTGNTLRFGVFGAALSRARHAASVANTELVVTDNVAAHCPHTLQAISKGLHAVTEMMLHHPPTFECHPSWLCFTNPALERRFVLHHNGICLVPEVFWMMLGLLSVAAYARAPVAGAPWQPLTAASVLWVVLEAITLVQVTLYRAWFLRNREIWAVVMRVLMCVAVCAFSHYTRGLEQLMLGYGTAAMVMNSLGHKVRYHVQLAVSAVTTATSLVWMSFDHWTGAASVPPMLPVVLVMLGFVAPAVMARQVDRSARLSFAQKQR